MSYRHPALRESALAYVVYDDLPILVCKDSTFFLIIATFPQLFLFFFCSLPLCQRFFSQNANPISSKVSLFTLRAERRSAPCCVVDSREVSSRQQGAEWQLAESRVKVRKKYCKFSSIFHKNARIACIYWLFGRWKRQFSLPHIFHLFEYL